MPLRAKRFAGQPHQPFLHERIGKRCGIAFVAEFERQLALDLRSRQAEAAHGLSSKRCFVDGEFAVVGERTVARKAVSFESR